MSDFGPRFQSFLDARNLTQAQAGKLLGWSQQTIQYYCRKKGPPRPHALEHMSRAFKCSVYDIIGNEAVAETASRLLRKRIAARQNVVTEEPALYAVDPWASWGKQLRAAWKRDQAKVELAVRSAWPKAMAEDIIAWLAKEK